MQVQLSEKKKILIVNDVTSIINIKKSDNLNNIMLFLFIIIDILRT